MNNKPLGYDKNVSSTESMSKLNEKLMYERRLTELLEDLRKAALGIDYQTKVHLKLVEKRIINKLIETEREIKTIIKEQAIQERENRLQGRLFDER